MPADGEIIDDRQRAVRISSYQEAFAEPLLQWKGISYSECESGLQHPACNAHALYCHLWPTRLYNIFPHYLTNGTMFEKKLLTIKCVLIMFTTLTEIFVILRRTE
jgi:hypothetical protein